MWVTHFYCIYPTAMTALHTAQYQTLKHGPMVSKRTKSHKNTIADCCTLQREIMSIRVIYTRLDLTLRGLHKHSHHCMLCTRKSLLHDAPDIVLPLLHWLEG